MPKLTKNADLLEILKAEILTLQYSHQYKAKLNRFLKNDFEYEISVFIVTRITTSIKAKL